MMLTFTFWLWFVICIASIVLEIATLTALVSIWFAIGAMLALGAYAIGWDFTAQVLVFFITSFAMIIILRPLASKYIRGNTVATNADRLIHVRTALLEKITPEKPGQIRFNGLIWNAVSDNGQTIEKDQMIEVIAIEGNKVIVRQVQ